MCEELFSVLYLDDLIESSQQPAGPIIFLSFLDGEKEAQSS